MGLRMNRTRQLLVYAGDVNLMGDNNINAVKETPLRREAGLDGDTEN
jgi:hypothetical protein